MDASRITGVLNLFDEQQRDANRVSFNDATAVRSAAGHGAVVAGVAVVDAPLRRV